MATIDSSAHFAEIDEKTYKQRIRAWSMYDWANSAFATTILAAVLPVYFSSVAGSTLPSEATATAYWSLGLSISLLVVAVLSPILGTISDVMRGKKKFLAVFAGIGILGTAALVLVGTGDWIMASAFAILGRIGFNGSITFYDALLPHVAREEDQDRVSATGFAIGYLGGGLLLAVNVAMIQVWGFEWGARISFVSVALWWLIFSIPLFRTVPEPPAATVTLEPGETILSVSFGRLRETLKDLQRYRELFKYLIAFLIYNDGIGTIIGVAAIYATELGFGTLETILALLLVQFVGVPYSLLFSRITVPAKRRPVVVAFLLFNLIALPSVAVGGRFLMPLDLSGAAPPPYETTADRAGEGQYGIEDATYLSFDGAWEPTTIPGDALRPSGLIGFLNDPFNKGEDAVYSISSAVDDRLDIPVNGQAITVTYSIGPENGSWAVLLDGEPLLDADGQPIVLDTSGETVRYNVRATFTAEEPGEYTFSLVNQGDGSLSITSIEVEPPVRAGGFGVIGIIIGILLGVNAVSLLFAFLLGPTLFGKLADTIDTKRGIILALVVYSVIAVWGFFLDSTIEFWFLAWMVAMVQGGSQGLSRSLYAAMSPASKSGEFFGLFSIMEKFASLLGPLMFAFAGFALGNSRWGVLSLVLFFIVGTIILTRVDVDEGKRVAREEDQRLVPEPAGD